MVLETHGQPRAAVSCDVLIVGGSIAGNFLASLLAGRGFSIHVIEAHSIIGLPMKCAGIVSSKILKLMAIPDDVILNRIAEAHIFSKESGKSHVTIRIKDRPVVLDRVRFDQHFMDLATTRGASYHLGERVTGIVNQQDSILVHATKGDYVAKVLVGCDGAHSIVARHCGIVHDFITGKQAIIVPASSLGTIDVDRSSCELHFDPSWNDLFAWVIPAGDATARVGLAARAGVASRFTTFVTRRFGSTLEDAWHRGTINKPAFTGGTIPIGLPARCAFDRILLVGDSACQVKASTGGGIVMLAIAARAAARAILQALVKEKFSRRFFTTRYQAPFLKQALASLRMHMAIHAAIKHFSSKDFAALFSIANRPFIKKELARTADMDFPVKFIMRILGEPSFYGWLLRFMLRDPRIFHDVLAPFLARVPLDASKKRSKDK